MTPSCKGTILADSPTFSWNGFKIPDQNYYIGQSESLFINFDAADLTYGLVAVEKHYCTGDDLEYALASDVTNDFISLDADNLKVVIGTTDNSNEGIYEMTLSLVLDAFYAPATVDL